MAQKIRVAVAGAGGKMGKEVVKLVLETDEFELVAAVDHKTGMDAGTMVGKEGCGIIVSADLETALGETKADVLVDFTVPQSAASNTETAIRHKVRPVVGTTGFTPQQIADLDKLCREQKIGGIIAPNFSIGAVLMMKFAHQAAKYMPHVEIIEYHGDHKLDAPSGTAVKTAELISQTRAEFSQGNPREEETIVGARGGNYNGFRIHSVRLPGIFAQQEVIFGGNGQTLKIRHDSYERSGYMPGVKLAIEKVLDIEGIIYGFENIIE